MAAFEKFNFTDINSLKEKCARLGVNLELSDDISPVLNPVRIGDYTSANSMAILPMEGCDSELDGSPTALVLRRYTRFARGGAGLIWFEACAVTPEGRANERQMMLTKNNLPAFRDMLKTVREAAHEEFGPNHNPICILQLTHSGRYSRPVGHKSAPIVPVHDPLLDPGVGLKGDEPVVSDDYLDALADKYILSAHLAREAGFDGVDVKCCHRYLLNELLSSFTRTGKYGGSFENRIRLPLEIVKGIKSEIGKDFIIASRLNVYDAHPWPYGFGVDKTDMFRNDNREPIEFVKRLVDAGVGLLSNSAGNPYYRYPQFTRPLDIPALGGETPCEHPLESVARLFRLTGEISRAAGGIPVIGNGYSWLRDFIPNAGAANIISGCAQMVGLGRCGIAYPDAVRDLMRDGAMKREKCCITCSSCTQMMRDHGVDGCIVRDGELYRPLYKKYREEATIRNGK